MTLKILGRRLFNRVERFSWGGEIVARHKITKHVTVTELRNPVGAHLEVGWEDHHSSRLTAEEAGCLAQILARIAKKSNDGATP